MTVSLIDRLVFLKQHAKVALHTNFCAARSGKGAPTGVIPSEISTCGLFSAQCFSADLHPLFGPDCCFSLLGCQGYSDVRFRLDPVCVLYC